MSQCLMCGIELSNDNKSEEHIIPRSIGGRLKSKKILCKKCNNWFGINVDHGLTNPIVLTSLLNIKIEGGQAKQIYGITEKGEKIIIAPGLKPLPFIKVKTDESGMPVSAKSIMQLKSALTKYKLRRSNDIDVDKIMALVEYREERPGIVYFPQEKIGGKLAFISIVKSAIGFYLHNNGNINVVLHLRKFLRGKERINDFSYFYYPDKEIHSVSNNEVSHFIHLFGSANQSILYCYIELFNAHNFMVILDKYYDGEEINISYCYDLLSQQIVNKEILYYPSREELINLVLQPANFEKGKQKVKRVKRIAEQLHNKKTFPNSK